MALLDGTIATGQTGHISDHQHVHDKLNACIDVKADFGAAGDGVTDDTSAISAAKTAAVASEHDLYFPSGTYITAPIAAVSNLEIRGAGSGLTTLKLKAASNAPFITGTSTSRFGLRSLSLDVNGANQSASGGGVSLTSPTDCLFENLRIINSTQSNQAGLVLNSSGTRCLVRDVVFETCQLGVQVSNGMTDTLLEGVRVIGHTATAGFVGGIYVVTNCHRTTLRGCSVSGGSSTGIYVSGSNDVVLDGCRTTGNLRAGADVRGFHFHTCLYGKMTDCHATGNGENGFFWQDATSTGWTVSACSAVSNDVSARPGGNGFEMLCTRSVFSSCYSEGNHMGFYSADGNTFQGCVAYGNLATGGSEGHGFRVHEDTGVVFDGCSAIGNQASGLKVTGGGLSRVLVVGGSYNTNTGYGIESNAANSKFLAFEATGNATAATLISGSGTTHANAYTPTNVTTDRSYDANATTTDELADILGTLIADLKAQNVIA